MKRLICAVLTLSVLLCSLSVSSETKTSYVTLKAGSYVSLGSYMGSPIIWRCVGEDENGVLLVSRDILCFKAYSVDSARWDTSFLRTWLNSASTQVKWGEVAPDEANTDANAYSNEAGFLCGFSFKELSLIKTVSLKSIINDVDHEIADEGDSPHIYNSGGSFSKSIQNYASAYKITTSDKVFCLNISQLETIMALFPSEFISVPTQAALEQSGNIKNSESTANGYYWLRDSIGNGEFPDAVRCIYPDGRVLFADADNSSVGVRPAIYVDKSFPADEGNGYESSPYALFDTGTSSAVSKGSSDENNSRLTANGAYCSITEGDYLIMGSYLHSDIVWRCVDINENGALMLSEKILCFKAFDSSGKDADKNRSLYGSGSWETSNIRRWLNSSDENGVENWARDNPPTADNCQGYNGYSAEKGFLANFSPEERAAMKTVQIRTIINPIDIDESTVGSQALEIIRNLKNISNYADAWSSYTDDCIFLLGIEEAAQVKAEFGSFLTASPSAEAVNSNEAYIEGLSADKSASWWLRDSDPMEDYPQNARLITADGWVHASKANSPSIGIRPAFYLDMDNAQFVSGSGSRDNPYRAKSHSYGEWVETAASTCTQTGRLERMCSECGGVEAQTIPALGHKFGEEELVKSSLLKGRIFSRTCQGCGLVYTYTKPGALPVLICIAVIAAAVLALILRRLRLK